jgi:hypothetical protein
MHILKNGNETFFSNSWIGFGFNVVTFSSYLAVLSTSSYDTYSSVANSAALLTYLQGLPAGTLVALFTSWEGNYLII